MDKHMSDYLGGMTIEHSLVLDQYPMSILTGRLKDQSALIGILNSLYDFGYTLISVECIEARQR